MAKGIIRIYNSKINKDFNIITTDDVKTFLSEFESGNYDVGRYKYKDQLKAEVVFETEDDNELAIKYSYYKYPELSRVTYSNDCRLLSTSHQYVQGVKGAVDYMVEKFPEAKYSFEITCSEGVINAFLLENGKLIERYDLRKGKAKEPFSRGVI